MNRWSDLMLINNIKSSDGWWLTSALYGSLANEHKIIFASCFTLLKRKQQANICLYLQANGMAVLYMREILVCHNCLGFTWKFFHNELQRLLQADFVIFFLQGFGATARSTQDCRRANPTDIVCFHQADVGEYLRSEDTLTWQKSENNKRTGTSQFGFFLAL